MKIKLTKPVKIALFLQRILCESIPKKDELNCGFEFTMNFLNYGFINLILTHEEIYKIRKLYIEGKLFYD